MEVSIPPELQSFVEQEFATGMYGSREEVVLQAVTWLREERAQALEAIKEGLEDVSAGRTKPMEQVFDDLRAEFSVPRPEYLPRSILPAGGK